VKLEQNFLGMPEQKGWEPRYCSTKAKL